MVDRWLSEHPGWACERDGIAKDFARTDFADALALTVRLAMIAEKRNHHPDLALSWGKVGVFLTTHDAGGITKLDLDVAESADAIA